MGKVTDGHVNEVLAALRPLAEDLVARGVYGPTVDAAGYHAVRRYIQAAIPELEWYASEDDLLHRIESLDVIAYDIGTMRQLAVDMLAQERSAPGGDYVPVYEADAEIQAGKCPYCRPDAWRWGDGDDDAPPEPPDDDPNMFAAIARHLAHTAPVPAP